MNLNYRTIDIHAIADPKAQAAIRSIDLALRPVVQMLKQVIVMDPGTGTPLISTGLIPRQLPADPRTKATYGRLGEFALGTDGALYQKTVATEIDNNWRILGGVGEGSTHGHAATHAPDGSDPLATGTPINVDLGVNAEGTSHYLARADHHHHLDEDIAPTWTSPHRWVTPTAEITPATGALNLTATLPATDMTGAGVPTGLNLVITSPAGSGTPTSQSHGITALRMSLLPGYTGTAANYLFAGRNSTAGTGTSEYNNPASPGVGMNNGLFALTDATTAGFNCGGHFQGHNGDRNYGLIGDSQQPKGSAINIGVAGFARNTSQTNAQFGVWAALRGPATAGAAITIPNLQTNIGAGAALVADSGDESGSSLIAAFYRGPAAGIAWQWGGDGACSAVGAVIGSGNVPLRIGAHASQTADLFQCLASNFSTVRYSIDPQGRSRQLETTTPSSVADVGFHYTKDFSARTEFCYLDSSGAEVRLTNAGAINLTAANFANASNPAVNLTGSNGTATTAMRSDAVLILSQAIAPTWTATHTFTLESVHNGGIDVGTSGRFDSNVADAVGAYNFLFKPTTTLTSGVDRFLWGVQNSAGTKALTVCADGSIAIGASGTSGGLVQVGGNLLSTQFFGINFQPFFTGAGTSFSPLGGVATNVGAAFQAQSSGSTAAANVGGYFFGGDTGLAQAWAAVMHSSRSGSGTTTTMGGLLVYRTSASGRGTQTNNIGIRVGAAGGGTNRYGIIVDREVAGTIQDGIRVLGTGRIAFGETVETTATTEFINSSADNVLDLNANTTINLNIAASAKFVVAASLLSANADLRMGAGKYFQITSDGASYLGAAAPAGCGQFVVIDSGAGDPRPYFVDDVGGGPYALYFDTAVPQTFNDTITFAGTPGIKTDTIAPNSGSDVNFQSAINIAGQNIVSDATTGSCFGNNGNKIAFLGATPILQYLGGMITGGFTAGAGAAVDSLSTWTGGGGVSGNAYTVGDLVDALKLFGLLQ